jgi:hypothetical protein
MKTFKNTVLPVLLSTIWISLSEFVRNEFLFKNYWEDHYQSLGLIFPAEPINGMIWGLWSLFFAIAIWIIADKFSLFQTTFIAWFVGFVLMWVVTWNMGVLPLSILKFAIPLSVLEAFLASWIIFRFKTSVSSI